MLTGALLTCCQCNTLPSHVQEAQAAAAAGKGNTVAVGYLRSPGGLGAFEVTCTQGCFCTPLQVDSHHAGHSSQLHLAQLSVTRAGVYTSGG